MTTRRWNTNPTKSPAYTGGDDEPRAACRDEIAPFEAMFDHRPETRQYRLARAEAATVCARCPLTSCADRIGRANAA